MEALGKFKGYKEVPGDSESGINIRKNQNGK